MSRRGNPGLRWCREHARQAEDRREHGGVALVCAPYQADLRTWCRFMVHGTDGMVPMRARALERPLGGAGLEQNGRSGQDPHLTRQPERRYRSERATQRSHESVPI